MRHISKNKVFIVITIFLIVVNLFSCDLDEKNSDNTAKFHLESSSNTSSFFMESESSDFSVEAIIPKDLQNAEIEWSLTTTDINGNVVDKTDTLTHLRSDKVFIRLKDLFYLGDYELKATIGDETESYHFTLNSTKELENALVYSFVPIDKLDGENNGEFIEYSLLGKRLKSPEDRAILGKSISYSPSISSLLYITGETERLGELEVGENKDFYVSKIDEKGIYLQPQNGDFDSSSLSIYAGSKKKKDISINLLKTSPLDIKAPEISKERPHDKSGVVLSITADNVSTEYNSFEDGYSIDIKVKRGINGEEKTAILPINTKTENEWKTSESECYITAIEYGYDVYLPFWGEYTIDAKTVSITGESETTTYSFEVDANNTKNLITFDIIPSVKNNNWLNESLPALNREGKYEMPIAAKGKIKIPSGMSGEFLLFASFISDDPAVASYEKSREVLKQSSTLSFTESGSYEIYITHENAGKKIGNYRGNEYKNSSEIFHTSFSIINYEGIDNVDVIGKVSLTSKEYNYEFTLKDDNDIVKNFTIYGRLLQRNDIKYTPITTNKGIFKSDSDSVLQMGETYKVTFTLKEVKTEDDIKLAIYLVPKNTLTVDPTIKLLPKEYNKNFTYNDAVPTIYAYSDSLQDKYNTRKIYIRNVRDESGNFKKLAYTFTTDPDGNPTNWSEYTQNAQVDIYTPSKISPTIYVKATNYNETHTVETKKTIELYRAPGFKKDTDIFGTYGTHGAPYKNEMFKIRTYGGATYYIYIFECFRKSDNYVLERLYLFYDKKLGKWRVHKINNDGYEEFYDATIEDRWWIAKNYHQLFIYKTDQYCGIYRARKGYLYGKVAYSHPIFEGNEDNNKYCTVYKYTEDLGGFKICDKYTELPRIESIKEWI